MNATQIRDMEIKERQMYLSLRGLKACVRCSGQGGLAAWPGFTCYDCSGAGTQFDSEGEARSAGDIACIEMVFRARKAEAFYGNIAKAIEALYADGDDLAAEFLFDLSLDINHP